jgi:hypothetical protein
MQYYTIKRNIEMLFFIEICNYMEALFISFDSILKFTEIIKPIILLTKCS